ncbi:MAG: hypothetical protein IK012_10595 [Fibrobacter sp.]|uniref:hypothetical protein n=1 Tax=Fibrobacter sp. TaxID=35828 RepID=UPI0025BBFCD6|nr:hypothetical protein [Fibrobacter sp.]MBR4785679.1 hypothetical protein [Fibrobacter sp.]
MSLKKCSFLLAGLCLFGYSHSLDLKPSAQFFFPSTVSIPKDSKSVSSDEEWETEYVIEAGIEALFMSEFIPMRTGLGLGFRTSQHNEDSEAAPATLPVWGVLSIGRINWDDFISPYFTLRGGYLTPLTGDKHWWESPANFFVNCGVGAVFPMGFTLEVSVDKSSMRKSYSEEDVTYRVSSLRVGIMVGMNIEVSHTKVYKSGG